MAMATEYTAQATYNTGYPSAPEFEAAASMPTHSDTPPPPKFAPNITSLPAFAPSSGQTPINARTYTSSYAHSSNSTILAISDLVLRCLSIVSLVIALSLLSSASQTTSDGITVDYSQSSSFKYGLAASIIGAVYSVFQTVLAGFRVATGKLLLPGPGSIYCAFVGDQIIICVLLTGGTAAAAVLGALSDAGFCTATTYLIFCNQTAGSISMIFFGFLFVAASMTLSTYSFYKHKL